MCAPSCGPAYPLQGGHQSGRPSSHCSVPGAKDSPLPAGRPLLAAGPCPPSPPGQPRHHCHTGQRPLPFLPVAGASRPQTDCGGQSPRRGPHSGGGASIPPARLGFSAAARRDVGKARVFGDATAVPSAAELLAQQPLNFGLALSSSPPSLRVDPALQKQPRPGPVGAPLLCLWTRPVQPGAAAATRSPPKAPPRDTRSGPHSSPAGRGRSPTATAPGGCVQALDPAAPPAAGLPPRGGVASGRPALTLSLGLFLILLSVHLCLSPLGSSVLISGPPSPAGPQAACAPLSPADLPPACSLCLGSTSLSGLPAPSLWVRVRPCRSVCTHSS